MKCVLLEADRRGKCRTSCNLELGVSLGVCMEFRADRISGRGGLGNAYC